MENQELEQMIQREKDRVCEETGMSPERLEELKKKAQTVMDQIKDVLNDVDSSFERGFILNMVSEKCGYVSKLYIIDAMNFNEGEE